MPASRMMLDQSDTPARPLSLAGMFSYAALRRLCGSRFVLALLTGSALLVAAAPSSARDAGPAPVLQRTRPATVALGATAGSKAAAQRAAAERGNPVGKRAKAATTRASARARSAAPGKAAGRKAAAATRASASRKVARSSTSKARPAGRSKAASSARLARRPGGRAVARKGVLVADKSPVRLNRAQRGVVQHIVRKYRVRTESVERYVSYAHQSGRAYNLDPYLILAVMATESSFNPRAESRVGAQGLMQVHTKVHKDRFKPYGSTRMVWQPKVNIQVGSSILSDYIKRYGSERRALKAYVGAANLAHDSGYGRKVLRRRDEFLSVSLAARNGGASQSAAAAQAAGRNRTADL